MVGAGGGAERVKNMQRGLHKKTASKTIDGEKVDRYNTTSFFLNSGAQILKLQRSTTSPGLYR